ncbi:hypothetical protein A8L51_10135 [Pantoea stewartii]|nr:hypothetical protein [Pantoea stewartii]
MRANAHCRRAQARPAGSRTHTEQVTVGGTPRCARSVTLATTTDYAPEPAPLLLPYHFTALRWPYQVSG